MKPACLLLCLCAFSQALYAEAADPCAQMAGSALNQCRTDQQGLRQRELERQLQEQEQRQNQLDQQQREVQQQLETMRLQNETLRKQLQETRQLQETASRSAPSAAVDESRAADLKSWKAENPWFGSDYSRTEFALRYAKQLKKDRPDLTGRPLLDALSVKVNETFGGTR
jgi:TolA-binding protein